MSTASVIFDAQIKVQLFTESRVNGDKLQIIPNEFLVGNIQLQAPQCFDPKINGISATDYGRPNLRKQPHFSKNVPMLVLLSLLPKLRKAGPAIPLENFYTNLPIVIHRRFGFGIVAVCKLWQLYT